MDRIVTALDGFRQPKAPTRDQLQKMTVEATILADAGAAIIKQLLIERRAMDLLVDDMLAGKPGMAESIFALRKERLEG